MKPQLTTDKLIEILRQNNYKATPQRIAIFEALAGIDHPSAENVYEVVKKRHPSISLTTVYQTLHVFTKLGLLRAISLNDQTTRFDTNTHEHVNIICPICKSFQDYESAALTVLLEEIRQKFGEKPDSFQFDVYLVCEKCKHEGRSLEKAASMS